ncbi:MAG: AraC family ligand binding domain-containing protein [Candidatus Pristimantibacillus sp.]
MIDSISETFRTKSPSQLQKELDLLFFGKQQCLPSHSWGPGLRDIFVIHYIHSGSGQFSTGDRTYLLQAGQGFVIIPGTIVHYKADQSEPWTYSWIGFKGLHAKSYMQKAGLNVKNPTFKPDDQKWFDSFYEQLMEADGKRGGEALCQSILYRFIGELIECSEESLVLPKPSYTKESYINKAITYIEHSYSQKITIQDIAQVVGLDRTYLSSLFKERFAISLQTYLLQFRMNMAVELLHNKELSISDISRSVGYTDPFLFSKMFKKVIGTAPRHSRDQLE